MYHSKGRFAGKPFLLAPWQKDQIIRPLFGTLLPSGLRQYRTGFIELPRKNGKTQLAAAIALLLLFGDAEAGPEIYSAAADKDQARLVFGEAKRMLESSPELMEVFHPKIYRDAIFNPENNGVYRVLSADAPTKHGLNPHGVIVDELHAHKTRELWDVLTTAQGTREQPLTFAITTAGVYDPSSVCWQLHDYARKVRTGQRDDPSFYSVCYGAAETDDWKDRRVWHKANPALGDFLSEAFLENEFNQAEELPTRQNAFRQLYLNQWVQQAVRAIDLTLWDSNAGHDAPMTAADGRGRLCDAALDLSSVSDLSAFVAVFPCAEDPAALDVFARFWIPEAQLSNPQNPNAALYREWVEADLLTTTRGNSIDYDQIIAEVLEDAGSFRLRDLNIDRLFQGQHVFNKLAEEGVNVFPWGQSFMAYGPPMKEFYRRLLERRLHHGKHPILRWMADNVVTEKDSSDNEKISKHKSSQKVDGIAALVGALDRVTRHAADEPLEEEGATAYDDGGVFFV